jgi:SecD/SecF fusion protein
MRIMRKRVEQLGVTHPEIQARANQIDVALPNESTATSAHEEAQEEVGKTAQLYFYDWEPNVIGPAGKPAPTEATATGGADAGAVQTGLPEYAAVQRAAKRPAILHNSDTTWTPGCTPKRVGRCIYGSWYLLDTTHERVLQGPEEAKQNLYADGYEPPVGATVKAVRVDPGTVLVQARPVESASGKVINSSPNSWYVLNDDPVLTGADVKNPAQGLEEGGEGSGQPDITFGFTSQGQNAFQKLTKEIAHRGKEAQLPGVGREAAMQHFAVVLDGQLLTVPSIDYTNFPEGIDASTGSEITGGFTTTSAQNLANELQSGALPLRLVLIRGSKLAHADRLASNAAAPG